MSKVNSNSKKLVGGGIVFSLIIFVIRMIVHKTKNNKYDEDGYDRHGYDLDGFDKFGRNQKGYDRDGYDKDGYNSRGLDKEGFNRKGYGIDGFNRQGYDRQGYGRDKYNIKGLDRANKTRDDYSSLITRLNVRLDEAHQQLRQNNYRYAVQDARLVMEEILHAIIQHDQGHNDIDDSMLKNLRICEKKGLINNETLRRLHSIRRIGNENGHELDAEDSLTYNKVHFVIKEVRDLLEFAEQFLIS